MDEGNPQEEVNPRGPMEEDILGRKKLQTVVFKIRTLPPCSGSPSCTKVIPLGFPARAPQLVSVPYRSCWGGQSQLDPLCRPGKSTVLPSDLQTLTEG